MYLSIPKIIKNLCATLCYKVLCTTNYFSALKGIYYPVHYSLTRLIVATHETSTTWRRATYGMQNTMELRHSCLIVETNATSPSNTTKYYNCRMTSKKIDPRHPSTSQILLLSRNCKFNIWLKIRDLLLPKYGGSEHDPTMLVISHPPVCRAYSSHLDDAFCMGNSQHFVLRLSPKFRDMLRLPQKVTFQHAATSKNIAPATKSDTATWLNILICPCHEKWRWCLILLTDKTCSTLRPQDGTLQRQQIFCLPQKKHSNIMTTFPYSILLLPTLLFSSRLFSTFLYSNPFSSTLLWHSLLYSTLIFPTLLYSALRFSTLLFPTELFSLMAKTS